MKIIIEQLIQIIFDNFFEQADFDSTSDWFKMRGESIIHGDTTLKCGKRIILLTSKEALKILSRARDIGVDGTFKITPKPWKQVSII